MISEITMLFSPNKVMAQTAKWLQSHLEDYCRFCTEFDSGDIPGWDCA